MMTVESIEAEEEGARRKTLGQLLHELRRRAEIAEDFDDTLSSFLAHRNMFVHGITMRTEYNLSEAAGRAQLRAFMDKLIMEAWTVIRVLSAAMVEFVDSLGERLHHSFLEARSDEERDVLEWLRGMVPGREGTLTRRR